MGCILCRLSSATLENTPEFSMVGYIGLVKVIDVYDGDTVTLAFPYKGLICQHKCRIDGLDCAEIRTRNEDEKKFGYSAKENLTSLLLGKQVYSRFEKTDKFGRLLAKLWFTPDERADTRVDLHMINQGFGYEYHGEKKLKFSEWFDVTTGKAVIIAQQT